MIKKMLLIAAAAMGGIYLVSDEGKGARENLLKKKSSFEPVVKDLLKQANEVLDGKKEINSKEIKANIDLLINEAKKTLIDLDLDKTTETIKEAIRVASKKIRIAANESEQDLIKVGSLPLKNKKIVKDISKKNTVEEPISKIIF